MQELFEAHGVKPRQARTITENIIMAEMRGVPSHGCSRIFTHYLTMIKNQVFSLESKPVRKRITPFLTVYDGNNGFGHVSSYMAMRDSIRLSEKRGFTVVSVVNSTHFGIAS
ncbi:Ldh family oxidoreductase [Brevibacillus brevis]|uniref:Ldh family oxidoreductase n=1 Tax=Brevibacillus brevis TaxID=1393 RepID=UPI0037C8C2B4